MGREAPVSRQSSIQQSALGITVRQREFYALFAMYHTFLHTPTTDWMHSDMLETCPSPEVTNPTKVRFQGVKVRWLPSFHAVIRARAVAAHINSHWFGTGSEEFRPARIMKEDVDSQRV